MMIGLFVYVSWLVFLLVLLPMVGVSFNVAGTTALISVIYLLVQDYKRRYGRPEESHIPIVPSWPLIGPLPYVSLKFFHQSMMKWSRKLGPVFRIITAGDMYVFVSSYEAVREVCITKAKSTGGRPMPFLTQYMLRGTGILFSHKPDATWKSLRMASQKHLKQFGDGLNRLNDVISDVAEEMFTPFMEFSQTSIPLDPKKTVFDTALITIAYLITGVRSKPGDQIVEMMREYENTVLKFIGATKDIKFTQYDRRPWLRHLKVSTWKTIEGVKKLQALILNDVQKINREEPSSKSLYKVLMAYVPEHQQTDDGFEIVKDSQTEFSKDDVDMTVLSLLLAGVTTTSTSFYGLINILAHKPEIQEKLFAEVTKVGKLNEPITLADRQKMPYSRAVLFELLRYVSVVPVGVPHRTVNNVDICGVTIPNDTVVATNLWAMHHDPDFWTNPYEFNPDRFLDDNGDVIPADHANRKHLMPFGAGPRVCLGEALALARLFLWIATFAQRFTVSPAPGNTVDLMDARNYTFDGVVRICPYDVKLSKRNTYQV